MRHSIFPFVLCLFFAIATNAQQKVEGGLFLGVANYQGDLAEDQIEIGETKLAYGGYLSYLVNPKFILRGNAFYGELTGSDANSPTLGNRGWSFKGEAIEVGLNGQWLLFGKARYNNAGIFTPQVSPYLYAGIGIAVINSELSFANPDDAASFPEVNDTNNFIAIPIGMGVRFDLHEHFALGFEGGFRPVFNDYIDGVSVNGNPNKNDWYIFTGVTLSYVFGAADNFRF